MVLDAAEVLGIQDVLIDLVRRVPLSEELPVMLVQLLISLHDLF